MEEGIPRDGGVLLGDGFLMSKDFAIDLGTANTLVYASGQGITFNEPTVIAVHSPTGKVLEMGERAWDVIDRAPGNVTAVRPLRDGKINDFDVLQRMMKLVLERVQAPRFPRPRVLIAVPSAITQVERRAIEQATKHAGGRSVVLVEGPLAAAIGAGLPVHEPVGNLIVDIGGGTTEMAVVSMGGVVDGRSIAVGGFDMDAALQRHVNRQYGLVIGDKTAERVKMAVGSAYPTAGGVRAVRIRGRDAASGGPKDIELTESEVREALSGPVREIAAATRKSLAEAPPELTHDVLEGGLFLTGGGGLLRGMDMLLAQECEVPVILTERPLETVILGAGKMLEQLDAYKATLRLETRR